jgi:hypothetical protein
MKSEIGTIIHGTLRMEDLIPAFADELERLDEEKKYDYLVKEARDFVVSSYDGEMITEDDHLTFDSEDANWSVEELIDALNEFAPDGCYFGAHEGDGSDFGFWPNIS